MLSRLPNMRGNGASRELLSAFGPALHGYHRGPRAFFPEPIDVWLAVLMDAVPFFQNSLVICPSTMSKDRAALLLRRAQEHLPSAHLGQLRRRSDSSNISNQVDGALDVSSLGGHMKALRVEAKALPQMVSPLESISPQSLDLVVFAPNVFGEEMLYDAPWHLSLAHRCLHPHGVVAIMGYTPRVQVVAPETARRDADDFLEDVQRTASRASEEVEPRTLSSALKRAMEISTSLESGHADIYFPFTSTRRRWFVSEYPITPAQLAASYRVLPEYQLLSSGIRGCSSPLCGDFAPLVEEQQGGEMKRDGFGDGTVPVNVCRRRNCVDPLEALQGCLQAREMPQEEGHLAQPSLRAHVRHFVITCSSRSVNAPLEHDRFPSVGGRPLHLR